ncbi:hypothetical protein [Streptomyces sp. PD-S100-1]
MSYDDNYEDFEHADVPDDYCPFHPGGGCKVEDHFPNRNDKK